MSGNGATFVAVGGVAGGVGTIIPTATTSPSNLALETFNSRYCISYLCEAFRKIVSSARKQSNLGAVLHRFDAVAVPLDLVLPFWTFRQFANGFGEHWRDESWRVRACSNHMRLIRLRRGDYPDQVRYNLVRILGKSDCFDCLLFIHECPANSVHAIHNSAVCGKNNR